MKEIMNEYPALALLPGLILGAVYFGGLWLTVRYAIASRLPAISFVGSYVVRTAVALGGFYYVGKGSWQSALICLAGFIMARYMVIYSTKREEEKQKPHTKLKNYEA
jgi:F1F0 ATPase subunit 2